MHISLPPYKRAYVKRQSILSLLQQANTKRWGWSTNYKYCNILSYNYSGEAEENHRKMKYFTSRPNREMNASLINSALASLLHKKAGPSGRAV